MFNRLYTRLWHHNGDKYALILKTKYILYTILKVYLFNYYYSYLIHWLQKKIKYIKNNNLDSID